MDAAVVVLLGIVSSQVVPTTGDICGDGFEFFCPNKIVLQFESENEVQAFFNLPHYNLSFLSASICSTLLSPAHTQANKETNKKTNKQANKQQTTNKQRVSTHHTSQ